MPADGPTEPQLVARGEAVESERATLAGEAVAEARAVEGSLVSAGQRDINRIWERTQQVIALSVVEITLVVVSLLVVAPALAAIFGQQIPESSTTAATAGMIFLASVANLVIGFYFGRTNHTRVGGVDQERHR